MYYAKNLDWISNAMLVQIELSHVLMVDRSWYACNPSSTYQIWRGSPYYLYLVYIHKADAELKTRVIFYELLLHFVCVDMCMILSVILCSIFNCWCFSILCYVDFSHKRRKNILQQYLYCFNLLFVWLAFILDISD